jgi:ribosomal protein L37AE/L43A
MGQNANGTATCDRCGVGRAGYGVLYGMVVTDLDEVTQDVNDLFVCYTCRPTVLEGLLLAGNVGPDQCTHCGLAFPVRAVEYGLLAADIAPGVTPESLRQLFFCQVNGSRALFLARLET